MRRILEELEGSWGGYFKCVCMCGIFKKNKFLKVNSGSMLIHVQVGLVLQSEALAQVGVRGVYKYLLHMI